MDMHIETLVVGPIETNCYIVSDPDTKEAVIIDAGDEAPYILNYIAQHDLKVTMLLNTHGHYDHTQANDTIREVILFPTMKPLADKPAAEATEE